MARLVLQSQGQSGLTGTLTRVSDGTAVQLYSDVAQTITVSQPVTLGPGPSHYYFTAPATTDITATLLGGGTIVNSMTERPSNEDQMVLTPYVPPPVVPPPTSGTSLVGGGAGLPLTFHGHSYSSQDTYNTPGVRYDRLLGTLLGSPRVDTRSYPGIWAEDVFYAAWGNSDIYFTAQFVSGSSVMTLPAGTLSRADEGIVVDTAFATHPTVLPANTTVRAVLSPTTCIVSAPATVTSTSELIGLASRNTIAPPMPAGIVVLDALGNNIISGGNTAATRAACLNSLIATIGLLSAASRVEDTTGTTAGTWTTNTLYDYSGGTEKQTVNTNDTIDLTFSGDRVVLILRALQGVTGTADIIQGGTTLKSVDLSGQASGTNTAGGRSYAPFPVLLTGLGAGSHTIRIKKTGGAQINVDAALPQATNPPTVVLCKSPQITYGGTTSANVNAFNALVDTAAALFPNVVVFDPTADAGFNPATMLGPDQLHPNDRGMACIARGLGAKLLALPYRLGQNTGV